MPSLLIMSSLNKADQNANLRFDVSRLSNEGKERPILKEIFKTSLKLIKSVLSKIEDDINRGK